MVDWSYLIEILPPLLVATVVTIRIALIGFALSLIVGLAIATIRLARIPVISSLVFYLAEFIRLTPLIVQLFFAYYVLPEVGISIPAEPTGIIVIGLHYSTYTAEVFRSGILAVPKGQWEAGKSLRLSRAIIWRKIILPQAVRPMVPALGNYLIALFKEVPLLATITVYELLNTANLIAGQSFRYFEVLTSVAAIFFVISYASSVVIRRIEVSGRMRERTAV
jgi:polar amino acid transport system permease protein